MSGGVDSSVAAALLKDQGYNVIGVSLKLWKYQDVGGDINFEGTCCSINSINNARDVCHQLGIPHYVLDLSPDFERRVIQNFISEYLNARTPNPCIICNTEIKWNSLFKKCELFEAELFATGHYARIERNKNRGKYSLLKGIDMHKDQSYVLWGLNQHHLKRTIFPLGNMIKEDVRKFARERELKTAAVPESQEICFIPHNDYRKFIKQRSPELENKLKGGAIIDEKGKVLGIHNGYPFYTIGQRRRLGLSLGHPLYVRKIYPDINTIEVCEKEGLKVLQFVVKDVNWINGEGLKAQVVVITKVRYNHSGTPSTIFPLTKNQISVIFKTAYGAVTPGQSAVFYRGEEVLGGGIIDRITK